MKLLIFIILILNLSLSTSFSAKERCGKFKKFSKNHIACKASNLKTGTKILLEKLKMY